jgi:NAD(P)H dehydrogenase (quinone)
MILVTGASGQLGRLVIESLLEKTTASNIVAAVRNIDSVKDLAEKGVHIRQTDYTQPDTLVTAFANVEKILLISSSEVGQREIQHENVIEAAKAAGVSLIAYTSILKSRYLVTYLGRRTRNDRKAISGIWRAACIASQRLVL